MRYVLEVSLDSAAFDGDQRHREVSRLLREVAGRQEREGALADGAVLRDVNGNTVGSVHLEEDDGPA